MKRIEFVCPNCDCESSIEEVNIGKIYYELGYIDDESAETIPTAEADAGIDITECLGYECMDCGYLLEDIKSVEDLYHWLNDRGMLVDGNP